MAPAQRGMAKEDKNTDHSYNKTEDQASVTMSSSKDNCNKCKKIRRKTSNVDFVTTSIV